MHQLGGDVDRSEESLQAIFQATTAAMIVVREETISQCNRAALEMLGARHEGEVLGRRPGDFVEAAPTLPESAWNTEVFESDLKRCDGSHLRAEVTVTPFMYAGNRHLLYGCYNLSAQKQIQEALKVAMHAAENANLAKSSFLATMSHEIRTPLNGIIGLLHLARQTADPEKQMNYLEKLERAAQGLLRIINDILDFSKIEAGQLDLEVDNFELDGVLDEVMQMLNVWSKDKPSLLVLFQVEPGLPKKLRGDSLRLTQILMNLCSNAVKFTRQGEIQVSIRKVTEDDSTILLEFSVRDSGIGMSPEQLARTFVPFSQADTSTTRIYGGTGLGLYISKRFVELLGGTIRVVSELGAGSNFTFTARFGQPTTTLVQRKRADLEHLRVMVIDENQASLKNFESVLGRLGCTATLLCTGEEGLNAANMAHDVVVLDSRLEQAEEVFQCLRLNDTLADALYLLLTRMGDREEMQRAYRRGFDGVLSKPVTEADFAEAVQSSRWRRNNNLKIAQGDAKLTPVAAGVILLVEDNEINQEVAGELLHLLGLEYQLASNGREALEALQQRTFDLILMDLQMPEMDGIEATRVARQLGLTTPIIALTANARREDRDLCLAAGMNDYIAKPINPAALSLLLRRYLQPGTNLSEVPTLETESENFPLVGGVDCNAGLQRLGGNRRLYRSLLVQFARRHQDAGSQLRAALAQEEDEQLGRLAHTIKGAAGNLGANLLADCCQRLEACLREPGQHHQRIPLMEELEKQLELVIQGGLALEEVEVAQATSGKVLNPTRLGPMLRSLRTLLDKDLGEAFSQLEQVVQEMEGTVLAPQAIQLRVWLEEFDVDQAKVLVDDILRTSMARKVSHESNA